MRRRGGRGRRRRGLKEATDKEENAEVRFCGNHFSVCGSVGVFGPREEGMTTRANI